MDKQLCLIYLFVCGALSCCIPQQWEERQKVIIGQMTGSTGELLEGKEYKVQHGICTVSKIQSNMENCISANATKIMSSYVGLYYDKVDVDTYKYRTDVEEIAEATVTRVNSTENVPCSPVETFVKSDGPPTATNRIVVTSTTGIPLMIKNHTVFDLPAACIHGNQMLKTGQSLGLRAFG